MNDDLIHRLQHWQANSFVLYSTAHGFHWNVEGVLFTQYHDFFEKIFEDIYLTIDEIAEYQRKLQSVAPFTLKQMMELTTYGDPVVTTNSPVIMSGILLDMIEKMIEEVKDLFDAATIAREQGIANFCADRQDKLEFWAWWLRSSIKTITN